MVNKSLEFLGIEKEYDKTIPILWGSLGCRLGHKLFFDSDLFCIPEIFITNV